jgi:hypothetical protein
MELRRLFCSWNRFGALRIISLSHSLLNLIAHLEFLSEDIVVHLLRLNLQLAWLVLLFIRRFTHHASKLLFSFLSGSLPRRVIIVDVPVW